ncbi:hypothetical protein GCM10022419_008050 [Nonomuraea rosea]|uniref:Uncharacterized protein n=1 Tax=Nonomuraea rosea TaxID=638574 RepID=A0ABP6VD62_9ACTN
MTRQGLAKRLAALEALGRGDKWPFRLEDGRTVFVPTLAVLAVFTEGLDWCRDDFSDEPRPGEGSLGPFSHYLELLSQAVASPDDSMMAAGVVAISRRARVCRDTGQHPPIEPS